MIAVIGSVALNYHVHTRNPVDVDCLGSYEEVTGFIKKLGKAERIIANYPSEAGSKIIVKTDKRIMEFEICWGETNSDRLLSIIKENNAGCTNVCGTDMLVPTLDVLLTIKESHKHRKDSPFFLKTMSDILLLRSLGAKIPVHFNPWFTEREKLTYVNKLPNLNQSRKEFFDNSNSIYTLQHDDIHEAVKHLDRPAYEYYKPDATEVFTSQEMFYSVPEEIRLYGALEEVMVLSLERAIHPFTLMGDKRRWAFDMAHMKLSTSIAGGWFREYVYNTYDVVQAMYSEEYIDKFYKALANGQIKPFEGN